MPTICKILQYDGLLGVSLLHAFRLYAYEVANTNDRLTAIASIGRLDTAAENIASTAALHLARPYPAEYRVCIAHLCALRHLLKDHWMMLYNAAPDEPVNYEDKLALLEETAYRIRLATRISKEEMEAMLPVR